ncbi:LPS O-antigen chain length determinant protein WzzB [Salmonella enterica subsp. enterica serovar Choleraesuis]|nr:LPS O-antigen chain length determinant protein WzzB [Salmonella enterica subsp. enterica serovar Choleraesuis]
MTTQDYSRAVREDNRSDEIDLIDLMLQLWRARITIIIFMIMTVVLAGGYLVVAKEKWSSEAIISSPDAGQTANYMNAMNVLYAQTPSDAPSVVEVQHRFFSRFNSLISAFSQQLINKEQPEELTIEPVVKGQTMPLKITYSGDSAENAQSTLSKYLQIINQRVVRELDEDLTTSINSRMQDLKESLASQERIASEKRQQRLKVISQALKVAEQSGIKTSKVSQAESQSEDTLYLLGSEALAAMLENESTRPLPLNDYYYNTRRALVSIGQLKSQPDSLYSFRYVMKPDLPLHRDSPKRALIMILAALFGGILGAGVVLGRNALNNYQTQARLN